MVVDFLRKNISTIKYIFTFVYLIYFSCTYNSYINYRFEVINDILYTSLVFIGGVILLVDFLVSGLAVRFKYSWLLILFYISLLISILSNISYNPIGNIKVVVWILIQTMVLATVNNEYKDEFHLKRFRILFEGVAGVFFINSLVSLIMFILKFGTHLPNDNFVTGYVRVGFVEGRLFGIFIDPNYASMCVMFTMMFIIINMMLHKTGILMKIYHTVLLVVDFIYIVLSRSRTTELCFYVALATIGFFLVLNLVKQKGIKTLRSLSISVIAMVLSVAIGFCLFTACDFGAEKLYVSTSEINTNYDKNHDYKEDLIREDVTEENISNNRFAIWKDYFKVSFEKPLFGSGPRNELEYIKEHLPDSFVAKRGYSSHNGYLALLVGSGIIGSLLMLGFMLLNVKYIASYLIRNSGKGHKYYQAILILAIILATAAVAAVSLKSIFFCNSIIDQLFWFTFGYVLSLIRISEPEKHQKEPLTFTLREKIFSKATKT